ncbi:uncharacterized protein LOC132744879 [Ruditapes philippinarum]|uniref:uncharacterized protein LOC132744879 n=1 Tax=Ruditapes philippinarum TaxID=129788 RepID=UPI00295C1C20|nr:uncharacterized protein LOC132744879 [Ruditapes philippinarum]
MECEVKQKEAYMVRLKEELTKEKKKHDSEKKDLLLRLSKVTGGNLTLDNPNIANLSDKNRPTKLAEEFSELYDNEWTDTFEVLKTDEQDRTTFMLHLLQRASTFCKQISNDHMESIKKSLCSLTLRTQLPNRINVGTNEMLGILKNEKNQVLKNEVITMPFDTLQTHQRKIVMDLRKFVEKQLSNQLEMEVANVIASENDINTEGDDTVVKYIKKCVNICWTMCKHEPPVHIDFPVLQVNHKFDTNVFKPYTKSGKYLHFIVWPALFLYKDGPMLCKGVAQGKN